MEMVALLFCQWLLVFFQKKVNPKIIQLLLGHKSVKTTLEIYNNVNDNIDELIIYVNNLFLNN